MTQTILTDRRCSRAHVAVRASSASNDEDWLQPVPNRYTRAESRRYSTTSEGAGTRMAYRLMRWLDGAIRLWRKPHNRKLTTCRPSVVTRQPHGVPATSDAVEHPTASVKSPTRSAVGTPATISPSESRIRRAATNVWPLFLLVLGCRLGPDFHRPATAPLPANYRSAVDAPIDQDPTLTPWWESFHDPLLADLIQRAKQSNNDLREAYYRIVEARAQWSYVRGGLWPQVVGDSSYAFRRTSVNANQFVPSGNLGRGFNLTSVGFDTSWEIDLFGKIRRTMESAAHQMAAQEFAQRDVEITLLADVATSYVTLRVLQQRLEIAERNLALQQDTLRRIGQRVASGLSRPLDQHLAESNVHLTAATIPPLRELQEASIHRLAVLIGEAPTVELASYLGVGPVPSGFDPIQAGIPADLLRRRPDIRQAEHEVGAANARIGAAIADYYPQFTITGNASVDSRTLSNLFATNSLVHSVGPAMSWNLLTFGRVASGVEMSRARYCQAVAAYRQSILLAVEEVENSLVSYREQLTRRQSLQEAVSVLQKAVELSESEYASGLIQFQTVLDTQRQLVAAEGSLADADGSVILSLVRLYRALGGGWEVAPSATAEVIVVDNP